MKKTLFFLSTLLFIVLASCNDNKGGDPNDFMNYNKNKNKVDKDDNKDDYPNNRDYGMDRDYEDNSKGGSVVGRWRFIDFESEDEEEMSEEEIRSMKSATVEFKRDGSFSSSSRDPDGEVRKTYGTYTYRSGTLKTVEDNGKEETLEVQFRGKNKVILMIDGGTITMERD